MEELDCAELSEFGVRMQVVRLDTIHPELNGTKWFKPKYNLERIAELGNPAVLSFGGAWSNHLRALAVAGREFGFRTIGLVRGELVQPLNPVLQFARDCGMELHALSRSDYRRRSEMEFIAELEHRFGEFYLLPEGGGNALACKGCREIARYLPEPGGAGELDTIMLPCGTGVTLAGLLQGMVELGRVGDRVIGVSVLKAAGYLDREVRQWLGKESHPLPPWRMEEGFHAGGYARVDPALEEFLGYFARISSIPVEQVYSGKLFHAAFALLRRGQIPPGSRVVLLHTGGVHAPVSP